MVFRLISPSRKWQDVTHLAEPVVQSGRILFQQDGHRRALAFDQLRFVEAGSGNILVLPDPFTHRPLFTQAEVIYGLTSRVQVTSSANVQGYNWAAGGLIIGTLAWSIEGVA